MTIKLPSVGSALVDAKSGRVSQDWYLALLNIATTTTGAVVTSVNINGNNGITVAGSPITSASAITLGIGNLTCASAQIAGNVTAASVQVSATITAANVATAGEIVTGTLTAANVIVTAAVQAVNIAASGTVTAANIIDTGTITAANAVISASIQTVNLASTGTLTGASVIVTGTVTSANVVSTQTVASVGISATGRIEPSSTVGILGTSTNDNANAGSAGEYKSIQVLIAANVPLTSGVAADVTSLALSGGDWEVSGNTVITTSAATVVTNFGTWTSVTSATLPTAPNFGGESFFNLTFATGTSSAIPAPPRRFPLTTTTTVVLSTFATFGSGGAGAFGFLGARRVR